MDYTVNKQNVTELAHELMGLQGASPEVSDRLYNMALDWILARGEWPEVQKTQPLVDNTINVYEETAGLSSPKLYYKAPTDMLLPRFMDNGRRFARTNALTFNSAIVTLLNATTTQTLAVISNDVTTHISGTGNELANSIANAMKGDLQATAVIAGVSGSTQIVSENVLYLTINLQYENQVLDLQYTPRSIRYTPNHTYIENKEVTSPLFTCFARKLATEISYTHSGSESRKQALYIDMRDALTLTRQTLVDKDDRDKDWVPEYIAYGGYTETTGDEFWVYPFPDLPRNFRYSNAVSTQDTN